MNNYPRGFVPISDTGKAVRLCNPETSSGSL